MLVHISQFVLYRQDNLSYIDKTNWDVYYIDYTETTTEITPENTPLLVPPQGGKYFYSKKLVVCTSGRVSKNTIFY